MSALVAGLDLSSRRLDVALIPLDPSDGSDAPVVTLRSFEMPTWRGETTPAFRTVERCRVVRDAMRELLADVFVPHTWQSYTEFMGYKYEVVHVCVETPLGSKSRSTVLWELYGAILASIPSHIERDTITCQEWRRIIWPDGPPLFEHETPKDTDWKSHAVAQAFHDVVPHVAPDRSFTLDEHQAESYLIARACRERLEAAVKGAA